METYKINLAYYFKRYFWILIAINISFFLIYQIQFLFNHPLADGFPLTKEMGFPDIFYDSAYDSAWLMFLFVILKIFWGKNIKT